MKLINAIENFLENGSQYFVGRRTELHLALLAVSARSHLLIEDQPGMGKTVLAHLLSKLLDRKITRIQFTNDLLPSDILGGPIWVKDDNRFVFKPGPLFGEMILADELNRASPKTQSALLQAMEEGIVTIEGEEHKLSENFCVIATQNPYEQVGTNPLPESQLDRFSLGLTLEIQNREIEKKVLMMPDVRQGLGSVSAIIDEQQMNQWRKDAANCVVSDALLDYVLDIMAKLRQQGAHISPRAGQDLVSLSRLQAIFCGRNFVTPDDIQFLAPFVLGHRVAGVRGMKIGQHEVHRLIAELSIP